LKFKAIDLFFPQNSLSVFSFLAQAQCGAKKTVAHPTLAVQLFAAAVVQPGLIARGFQ